MIFVRSASAWVILKKSLICKLLVKNEAQAPYNEKHFQN